MKIDFKMAFDGFRSGPFPGKMDKGNVQGCMAIMSEFQRRGLTDLRWLAYMLATAWHETAHTMQPITEMGSPKYLRAKAYWPWIGRGYVQLTWDTNYRAMQKLLKAAGFDVDIVANPDDALRPDVAAFIMFEGMIRGSFRKKKLADYFSDTKNDPIMARNIINGTRKGEKLPDKAVEIANAYKAFHGDLLLAAA